MNKYSRDIIKMYIPTLISYLTFSLVSIIDAIFVGNFFKQQGQSSIVIIMPLIMIINSLIFSLVIGTNTYIGHAIGEKDIKTANRTFNIAFFYGAIILFIILILFELILNPYIHLFTNDPIIIKYANNYGKIILLTTWVNYASLQYYFIQRLLNKTHLMYITAIISLLTNMTLNYFFVVVLDSSIGGIAIASLISVILQILILFISSKDNDIFRFKLFKVDFKLLFKLFINGLSDGIYDISQAIITILNIFIFIYYIGNNNLSYLYVFSEVMLICLLVFFALSDSINPLISKNYGEGNFTVVNQYKKSAMKLSFIIAICVYIIFIVFRKYIFLIYGANDSMLPYLMHYSIFYFSSILIWPLNQLSIAYYTAISKSKISLQLSILRNFVILIITTIILSTLFKDFGLWISFSVCEIIVFFIIKTKYNKIIQLKD